MLKLTLFFILYPLMISSALIFGSGTHQPMMAPIQNETSEITFSKDIKPIMNTFCSGTFCHHGKPSSWTNYKTTKLAVDAGTFYNRVIEVKDMPRKKPLPEKEYQLIKKWLEEGAIE